MYTRSFLWAATLIACAAWTGVADEPPVGNPQGLDVATILQMVGQLQPAATSEDTPFPDFKQVTEGMTASKGLFTLWSYPPDAQNKDQQKLLAQIPAGFLGEQFMLSTSFSGGGFFTGFPLDERVVRWEMIDRQLVLSEPETRFVVNRGTEISDVVERTYPGRIRAAVPILTKAPNGDPVIDFGPLLKSEFADIAWASFFDGGTGAINPQLSKWTKRKAFELNVEIGVELATMLRNPPGAYDKKLVHYSFWRLPQTDYQPRSADDRIGYFLTTNRDWAKPTSARDIFNRYINRWHLVKRDPSLKLCEPRQPIIFYIEKTVPVKFRRAVRDGILEWNKAFEQIGFVGAIQVRQQTDDNEWKDLDPEDMRYSFFRWIVAGAGFAMGPHRANPFTGQVYDADIIFDDAMVRYFEQEAQQYLPEAAMAHKFSDPALTRFLEQNPQYQRPVRQWEQLALGREHAEQRELLHRLRQRACAHGMPMCDYMQGMRHQMSLAHTMLAGQPQEVIDRYLYDVIKEVVTHEVGHTLGLRHNFKASSIYTLDEIQKRRTKGEATCGSVMDYNPALLFAENALEGHFITPTIGPYDYWAIEYGYRPFDGNYESRTAKAEGEAEQPGAKTPEQPAQSSDAAGQAPLASHLEELPAEMAMDLKDIPQEILERLPPDIRKLVESGALPVARPSAGTPTTPTQAAQAPKFSTPPPGEEAMLRDIASRATEPELAYATDEDTTFLAPDPLTNRFDVGRDPIDWAESRMRLVDQRMAKILDWAVKEDEPWYHLRNAYLTLMAEKAFVFDYVGRFIGGQYFTRAHRGDPNALPPFTLVEPALQRRAMQFTTEHLYQDSFFHVPQDVLNHLAPPRWWHDGASISYIVEFPVHDYVALFQWWNLFDRLFPGTLRRLHDNELKTDAADKLTVAEYIRHLQSACWSDATNLQRAGSGAWSDTKPFVSSFRRSLQREYLGLAEPLVRGKPGTTISPDLHAMLRHALRQLSADLIAVAASGKLDFASQAHVTECKSRIDRMLSAELREYEPRSLFGGGFMQPAAGSTAP